MSDRKEAESAAGGLGFGGALTLLFVGLKLTGYIGWSWWWVLSPLWLGAAGVVAVAGVAVVVLLVVSWVREVWP